MTVLINPSSPLALGKKLALLHILQSKEASAYPKWLKMATILDSLTCPEIYKNEGYPCADLRAHFLVWITALIQQSRESHHQKEATAALQDLLDLQWPNYQHQIKDRILSLHLPFLSGLLCAANPQFFNEIIKLIPEETLRIDLKKYQRSWRWAAMITEEGIQRYYELLKKVFDEESAKQALKSRENQISLLQATLQVRDGNTQPVKKETIIFLHAMLGDTDFFSMITTDALNKTNALFYAVLQRHMDAAIQISSSLSEENLRLVLNIKSDLSHDQHDRPPLFQYLVDQELPVTWIILEKLSLPPAKNASHYYDNPSFLTLYYFARTLGDSDKAQQTIREKSNYIKHIAASMRPETLQAYVNTFFAPSKPIAQGHKHCLYLLLQANFLLWIPSRSDWYHYSIQIISGELTNYLPQQSSEATSTAVFSNLKRNIAEIVLKAYTETDDAKKMRAQKSKGMLALLDFVLFYFDAGFEKKDEYLNQLTALLQQRELEHKDSSDSYCKNPDKPVNQYYEAVILAASTAVTTLESGSLSQYCQDHNAQKDAERTPQSLFSSFSFKFLAGSSNAKVVPAETELRSAGGSTSAERFVPVLTIQPMLEDHSRSAAKKMQQLKIS